MQWRWIRLPGLGEMARLYRLGLNQDPVRRNDADARARQLNEIFAEYAGESANATAKALNDRGLPSGRGGKWTARSVINVRKRLEG